MTGISIVLLPSRAACRVCGKNIEYGLSRNFVRTVAVLPRPAGVYDEGADRIFKETHSFVPSLKQSRSSQKEKILHGSKLLLRSTMNQRAIPLVALGISTATMSLSKGRSCSYSLCTYSEGFIRQALEMFWS